ncbi:hypothetical protein HYS95_00775 [Candidatus Daviesbacteria bacterium]|nr:hypothetical protein [Candidatus Daviesbacteria bacterium]
MEDPKWLRLVTIGLVLAAVAVGYFLLSGRFTSDTKKPATQISQASPTPTMSPVPTQTPATPSPASAYDRIAQRTNGATGGQNLQTLPRTGFPIGAAAALSGSAILIGWGLKRFPH